MNTSSSNLSPDDPRLTAYALGELDEPERSEIEALLQDNPAARAAVEAIRATADQLEVALAAEPMPEVSPRSERDPYRKPKGRLLRFPRFYYAAATLAAACFAVLVALHRPEPKPVTEVTKVYTMEMPMTPAAPPVAADAAKADEAEGSAQRRAEAEETWRKLNQETMDRLKSENQLTMMKMRQYPKSEKSFGYTATKNVLHTTQMLGATAALSKTRMSSGQGMWGGKVVTSGFQSSEAAPANTESYAYQRESGFVSVAEQPLSTFAADVDTASYANVRRYIEGGKRPPVDAVRIEEMLNYFPCRYAQPVDDRPFAASMEVASAPWAPEHRLVRIGLQGRDITTAARPAANLVFLLDISGSMNARNKLPLVKTAMRLLVERLRPDDRVAIVTYAGASGLALPSTPVRHATEILKALDALRPEGSTNGAMGIQLAYDIAKANFVSGGLNRVILCTDGDFNVGVSSEGGLTRLIKEKAKSGVFLSVLGFGMGNYKDSTLEKLADEGNGNYGYIDTKLEAQKLLVEQVNGTLVTIAKDVKLQVEFNPAQVSAYRLIGYENRRLQKEDFNNDKVDAGEIGAGHAVTALYEVIPVNTEIEPPKVDSLRYQPIQVPPVALTLPHVNELLTLKVRYKAPDGDTSRLLEFPLANSHETFAAASNDFKFAAAVAGFGMVLSDSGYKGSATLPDVEKWAEAGTGGDAGGYRAEFIQLVRQAKAVMQ